MEFTMMRRLLRPDMRQIVHSNKFEV
uniref:Uncharacterized protein n=1 Tax=Arundo donax TaxID=35708 RepID=A0A0A9AGC7_ARUDO